MAKVVDSAGRKLFEGPVEAAKAWLNAHFPNVHVNPQGPSVEDPKPDAEVVTDESDAPAETEDENA